MGYIQSKQWIDIAEKFSSKIREEKEKVIVPACLEVLVEYGNSLPRNSNALDYGGGDGLILSRIVPHSSFHWYYYDVSAEQKKLFKKTHKLTNVPILDDINKKFKMIMCNHVINSMENIGELYFLFKTLHSLLLSKGIVLITINHPLFIYASHKYYSCSSTHLNYNDGVQLFTTVYDNNKGCIVFGDVYWSYDTILDVIERVGFITLKKKLLKYMAGITHLIFNLY